MRAMLAATSALSLIAGQITPAMAQEPAPLADRMARPSTRPAVPPSARPETRPARPQRPGGGFGGNGGSGGNGGGFGGNGGSWQGGNRPPPVRPPGGWGGSGGSWQGGNRPPPGWQGDWNGNNWGGAGWSGRTIRCESRDGRYRRCGADTRGGVRLIRNLSGTYCQQGRNWGYRPGEVWVSNGCRGEFQTRYGGGWNGDRDDGPSTGAVIGGVAVAAGLIALLASSGRKSSDSQAAQTTSPPPGSPAYTPPAGSTGQPARIAIAPGSVPPAAQAAFDTCLAEAARQIGATGGTEIQLDRLIETVPGNGGYRFRINLKGVYPDETRLIPTYCRATPTQLVELTFG